MDNLPIIKVFDIDYSFIIKNYLDPKMWEKEWTVFIYKNFVATIRLHSIDVKQKAIWFELKVTDNASKHTYWRSTSNTFKYVLQTDNIDILKKIINSNLKELFIRIERDNYIEFTDEYYNFKNLANQEKQKLTEIAENFLDENNVTNSDIREVYIDVYVDNNSKSDDMINDYIYNKRYTLVPDLFLVFSEVIKDENLKKQVLNSNSDNIKELLEELKELEEYIETEKYEEEMAENLEDI